MYPYTGTTNCKWYSRRKRWNNLNTSIAFFWPRPPVGSWNPLHCCETTIRTLKARWNKRTFQRRFEKFWWPTLQDFDLHNPNHLCLAIPFQKLHATYGVCSLSVTQPHSQAPQHNWNQKFSEGFWIHANRHWTWCPWWWGDTRGNEAADPGSQGQYNQSFDFVKVDGSCFNILLTILDNKVQPWYSVGQPIDG